MPAMMVGRFRQRRADALWRRRKKGGGV